VIQSLNSATRGNGKSWVDIVNCANALFEVRERTRNSPDLIMDVSRPVERNDDIVDPGGNLFSVSIE
jgi:hypothetical protein